VWYHGFGEPFPARLADIGTTLLLASLLQVAALGDFYARTVRRGVAVASAAVNPAYVL
jgi:hypothetical protein